MNKLSILALIFVLICTGHSRLIAHQKLGELDQHEQTVNVKSLANITNLQANNWILGKQTQEQYYNKRFEITKKFNTTLCPVNRPFVIAGTTTCAQCPENTPIYDLSDDTCKNCPAGEKYNQNLSICENTNRPSVATTSPNSAPSTSGSLARSTVVTNISNLEANNWVLGNLTKDQFSQRRFLTTKTQNTSLCPKDKPFVLKGTKDCKECPAQTPVFSLQTETCIGCAKDEKYNNQTKQCQNKNQTKVTSPHQKPSETITEPLADTRNYFYVSNLDADNWIMGAMTEEQYEAKRYQISKKHNTTLCPLSTPYVLKGKTVCQQCPPKTPIFVLANDTCIGCESGQYFNITTNRCENKDAKNITVPQTPLSPSIEPLIAAKNLKNVSNLDGNNWILGNITQQEYFAKRFNTSKYFNTSLCPINTPYVLKGKTTCEQCPPETPIFVLENDTCIGCIKGQHFNKTTGQCQKEGEIKPTPTNKYNCTSADCILQSSKHINITNLDAGNWILGNTTIEKYYDERFKITSSHNTSQCDIKTPYVISGNGGICEQCPEDRPIFVLANSTCLACPQGERWNATSRKCVKKDFPDIDTCSSFRKCPNGGFFDYQTNSCGSCEFGQYFDEEYQACLYCPEATPLLDSSFNCIRCPAGKSINRRENKCV